MAGGEGYAQRHLQQSDYFDQKRTVEGQWHGRGAELLGLSGKVTSEDFESLRQGLDPETGEFLRQRQGSDRISSDGAEQSKARSLYDMTFSAPKSVSVMAIVGGDERLIAAHETAVRETLQEAEKYAATRVRLAGLNENRTTGNWVVAAYTHDTSRELDPQLHTHAVAANLTYDGTEARWKALQASGLYERRSYLTEVYRNALAREVCALGYEIENRRDVAGKDKGFEIAGVSQEILDNYSRRSAQRDAAIEEFTQKRGRAPTDNEVAVLIRETRADKLQEISTEQVRRRQLERLTPDQQNMLGSLREEALEQSSPLRIEHRVAEASLGHAQEHVFERLSVAKEHEILTEALRYGRGQVELSALQGVLSRERTSGNLVGAGDEIATHASLLRERDMVAVVNRGLDRYDLLGNGRQFRPAPQLRDEQRRAVEMVLNSTDLAINVRGAAGTGKTATLREIDRGLSESGTQVVAVAPTRSAVDELQKVGFRDAMTVSRLLEDQESQRALAGKVMIVDEAGMVSGKQMQSLFRATNGELVKVKSVDEAAIRLEDGRTIPANYREFTHGYAITAHRSQGKTVDNVIISADAMKKELFYVAASRGRSEIAVVTSDRELLRESVGVSTARQSAMELVRKQQHGHAVDKAPEMSHESGFAGNRVPQIGGQHSIPTQAGEAERIADRGIEKDIGHSLGL
jgi:conjugative relaxase-like TrwC/TraI family protein